MKLRKLTPKVQKFQPARSLRTLEEKHSEKRLRGRALQERNRRMLQQHPLCVDCIALGDEEARRKGYTVSVDEWDHEKPLWEGGVDNETNIRGRCFKHHAEKSERERQRRERGVTIA
jgi:hypothetical protein